MTNCLNWDAIFLKVKANMPIVKTVLTFHWNTVPKKPSNFVNIFARWHQPARLTPENTKIWYHSRRSQKTYPTKIFDYFIYKASPYIAD